MYIKRGFKWANFKQDAFNKIKQIVARNILLTYPDFNGTFKVHINARAFQIGVIIIQKSKPIAFYSRKLTNAQQQYTVTE